MSNDETISGGDFPSGDFPEEPAANPTPRRRNRRRWGLAGAATATMLAVATGGAAIGRALFPITTAPVPHAAATAPFSGFGGSGAFSQFPGGNSGTSTSNASGGPSDPSTIAKTVDPGLVDVNTSLNYEDERAAGTGMVINSNGTILTNNHVIEGATSISVTDLGNGKTYRATVVGYDRTNDVAVIKAQGASGLKTVPTANSSAVRAGSAVVGIGNAGGIGGTPSIAGGAVTAVGQSITASDQGSEPENLTNLIATNAAIEAGDSGGPLVNAAGQVIGMDTAGTSSSGSFFAQESGNGSSGFAIPINEALDLAHKITSGTSSTLVHIGPTALLGVDVSTGSTIGGGFGGFGGFSGGGGNSGTATNAGVSIVGVIATGPAAKAGLGQGDTILSLGGKSIASPTALTTALIHDRPGQSMTVTYEDQDGVRHTTTVRLASGPPQ